MKIWLHEHPLSKKISRTVDPSHERSICISASPIVRLKQTEREIQLIISSSPSMNCPSKKSSPETQSRKEEHSRARKNKRKFNEKTVTLPSNQNTQRHQSSQRKSRTSESRQISRKFLPQLGFVFPLALPRRRSFPRLPRRLWGSRWWSTAGNVLPRENWSSSQHARGTLNTWLCKPIGRSGFKCTKNTWSNIPPLFLPFFLAKKICLGGGRESDRAKYRLQANGAEMQGKSMSQDKTHVMKCKYSPLMHQNRLTVSSRYNVGYCFGTLLCPKHVKNISDYFRMIHHEHEGQLQMDLTRYMKDTCSWEWD
jgi:hypothetical protein